MVDILTARKGDLVEYGPYLSSGSQGNGPSLGLYEDYMFWSPDERPVELWVNLVAINANGRGPADSGTKIFVRASQVTNIYTSSGS